MMLMVMMVMTMMMLQGAEFRDDANDDDDARLELWICRALERWSSGASEPRSFGG